MMNPSLTPNFIQLPDCPDCGHGRNVVSLANSFFKCTCGSVFQDKSYGKKLQAAMLCPECSQLTTEPNWQPYFVSLHYEIGTKQLRGNFHRTCYIRYNQRVEHESAVFNKEVTDAEIASTIPCKQCGKTSLYTYQDDDASRPHWITYIYQCMDCGAKYPPDEMLAVIQQVKEMRWKNP
jgi:hypothetical protein